MERDDAGEKEFDWDDDKAEANRKKHGVTFREAATVFQDPLALTVPDPRHSWGEFRNLHIGLSAEGRLLIVVYVEKRATIRLISSREATREERRIYEEGTY